MIATATRHDPLAPTKTTPAAVTVASPTAPAGLKKVTFGKIAAKKEETKTQYPVFPDGNEQAAVIARRIKQRTEEFESLKGALETDKAELKQMVSPHYFTVNQGKTEIPSSIAVRFIGEREAQDEVLVTFVNKYPQISDETPLVEAIGSANLENLFEQCFEVKIKGDRIPAAFAQDIMDKLEALFGNFNALDALEVKTGFKPKEIFHAARHSSLTPEQNLAVEQICPIQSMIKTKGRK